MNDDVRLMACRICMRQETRTHSRIKNQKKNAVAAISSNISFSQENELFVENSLMVRMKDFQLRTIRIRSVVLLY